MIIRKALIKDIDIIMRIYEEARDFMRSIGNGSQWGDRFPPRDSIVSNINSGDLYVCVDEINKTDEILGVFYFKVEDEPTYKIIDGGVWLNDDEPYGVVHRLAGSRKAKGIGAFCLDWCEKQFGNIRIDTHRDNIVMRKVLEKAGYIYCGIIYVANGSERMAFQKKEN
jgi:RimJ/RimL family protein N-acetyltransferase